MGNLNTVDLGYSGRVDNFQGCWPRTIFMDEEQEKQYGMGRILEGTNMNRIIKMMTSDCLTANRDT